MKNTLESLLDFVTKKEVFGTIIILAICHFMYHTLMIILENKINNPSLTNYEKKKRTTVVILARKIFKFVFLIIAVLALLDLFGVNIKSLVAGLGIITTIIGLALQDTLKDIINGIHIITENYFIVGDIVKYNNFTGTVIEFGLKSTKIKNLAGETMMVNNRNIYEIINISQQNQNVQLELNIAYEEDVEHVERVIQEKILPKINKIETVRNDSSIYLGINELSESSVKYLIQFHCDRDSQWKTRREALRIIKVELAKAKIKIPYPQMEVHNESSVSSKR